uniref:Uncharacterized protein n=1 Tax=mine drainage metagenome TaxID=410659 RepID=E6QQN6_9ZZZZ
MKFHGHTSNRYAQGDFEMEMLCVFRIDKKSLVEISISNTWSVRNLRNKIRTNQKNVP